MLSSSTVDAVGDIVYDKTMRLARPEHDASDPCAYVLTQGAAREIARPTLLSTVSPCPQMDCLCLDLLVARATRMKLGVDAGIDVSVLVDVLAVCSHTGIPAKLQRAARCHRRAAHR